MQTKIIRVLQNNPNVCFSSQRKPSVISTGVLNRSIFQSGSVHPPPQPATLDDRVVPSSPEVIILMLNLVPTPNHIYSPELRGSGDPSASAS